MEDINAGIITAEQAAEAAKGLTFEIVWAALMEDRRQMQESQKRIEESRLESQKRMEESRLESQKRMQESKKRMEKSEKRMEKSEKRLQKRMEETQKAIKELSNNIGGVNNALGRFTESLFSTGLDEIFTELGYTFSKQGPHVKFKDRATGKILAEADYFLEDGEYAMAVEVKTELKEGDVNDHMDRIAVIRAYFDERNDRRTLVGAVAGGIIHENVLKYAQKQGLYVITKRGDSAVIADMPEDFKARKW